MGPSTGLGRDRRWIMVIRAVCVGWVLVLGAWCAGQDGQATTPPAPGQEARAVAQLRFATGASELDGEALRFMVHRCYGNGIPVCTGGSDLDLSRPGYGHVISARTGDRVDLLWASDLVEPAYFSSVSMGRLIPLLHWDDAERRLWVALVGTSNATESRVVVWRHDIERDARSGALTVGAAARMEQEYTHEPGTFGPMFIDAARFTEEATGQVLNLYHHNRPKTRIEPEGRMEPSKETLEGSRLSDEARTSVREAVRIAGPEFRAPGLRVLRERETDVVEVAGTRARFVMHRVPQDGPPGLLNAPWGGWYGPGHTVSVVPVDEPNEPNTVWFGREPMMRVHSPVAPMEAVDSRTTLLWDEEQRCLWIGAGFSRSASRPLVEVHRLELRRGDGAGAWEVADRRSVMAEVSSEGLPDDADDAAAFSPIVAVRFVRTGDGGIGLEIERSEGGTATLGVPGDFEEGDAYLSRAIGELILELIRENLAEAGGDE